MKTLTLIASLTLLALVLLVGCTGPVTTPTLPQSETSAMGGTATLTGMVRDQATNRGIREAVVSVNGTELSATTDMMGRFEVTGIAAGRVTVTVTAGGYASQEQTVFAWAGRQTTLNAALQRGTAGGPGSGQGGATLTGMVRDQATNRGIREAVVSVNGTALSATTDMMGRFELTGVAAGRVTVTVAAQGYAGTQQTLFVQANRSATLNVSLRAQGGGSAAPSQPTMPGGGSSQPLSQADLDLVRRYGWGGNTIIRWPAGTVQVQDSTGFGDLGRILREWSGLTGGVTTFQLSQSTASPVSVYYDRSLPQNVLGMATVWYRNYEIVRATVAITPNRSIDYYCVFSHEIGHVVGFGSHTNDGGVMDAYYNGSRRITDTVQRVIRGLYSLPVGPLSRHEPGLPPDGVLTIPITLDGAFGTPEAL